MLRFHLRLNLLAVLLASCSAPAAATATITPSSIPTVEPTATPATPPFRIIAYATDGIIESIIPYDKLTHINYAFLTPKDDGTFTRSTTTGS